VAAGATPAKSTIRAESRVPTPHIVSGIRPARMARGNRLMACDIGTNTPLAFRKQSI
jgi:hypothetical protein